jgi:LysR family nitrogen assimilation transcriptional regulator
MDFKQLEYFVLVAQQGSFSRAAAMLGLGQPFLSRQIRQLEIELSKHLFHRNGRGTQLTDEGERFLLFAEDTLQNLEAAKQALSHTEAELTGRVVVGLPPSLGRVLTIPLVQAFSERFPKSKVTIAEALSRSLHERLVAEKIDMALMYDPVMSPLARVEPIVAEPLYLIVRRTDEPSNVPVPFSQLVRYPLIFPCEPHPVRGLVVAEAERQGMTLDIRYDIDSVEAIMAMVDKGWGATVAPRNLVRAGMQAQGLLVTPLIDPVVTGEVALVTSTRRPANLLVSKATDVLREVAIAVLRDNADGRWDMHWRNNTYSLGQASWGDCRSA